MSALQDCRHLRISDGIIEIESRAFEKYAHLKNYDGVPEDWVFDCNDFAAEPGIRIVIMPDSVRKISAEAFQQMVRLKTVHFSSTLKSIGKEAFHRCDSLKEIILPNTIKKIGRHAFLACCSLER